jgi:TrmH family RNA methyltransferase
MNPTRQSGTSAAISGRHHPLMKRIRAMLRSGNLRQQGEVLLETSRLIEDAILCGVAIHTILVSSDAVPATRQLLRRIPASAKRYEIGARLFPELTSTEHSAGILALAEAPVWKEAELFSGAATLLVVLAGIQDPGNLGAVLRAAEAFGASGVLATKGTVSPFNSKAVRAAAGTLFRLPMLLDLTAAQTLSLLRRNHATLLASAPRGGTPLAGIDVTRPLALALGSEGSGLPRELAEAGNRVSIPIVAPVESLNVATAAAVMLYEIARQRAQATSGKVK